MGRTLTRRDSLLAGLGAIAAVALPGDKDLAPPPARCKSRYAVTNEAALNIDHTPYDGDLVAGLAALPPTRGGTILVPYRSAPRVTTAPAVVPQGTRLLGAGRYASLVENATTDVLQLGTSAAAGSGIVIEGIRFTSKPGGGHVLVPGPHGMGRCEFHDTWLWQENPGKSVFRSENVPVIGCHWVSGQSDHVDGATVPGWHGVTADGSFNGNRWGAAWWHYYSGEYGFHFEQTAPGSYVYDNHIAIIAEICRGGLAKILSGQGNVIEGVRNWDMQAIGTSTRDWIVIGQSAAGPASTKNHIIRPSRSAGALGAGLKDIRLPVGGSGQTTIRDPSNATGSGYMIDLGSTLHNTLTGYLGGVTLENSRL